MPLFNLQNSEAQGNKMPDSECQRSHLQKLLCFPGKRLLQHMLLLSCCVGQHKGQLGKGPRAPVTAPLAAQWFDSPSECPRKCLNKLAESRWLIFLIRIFSRPALGIWFNPIPSSLNSIFLDFAVPCSCRMRGQLNRASLELAKIQSILIYSLSR